MTEANEKKELPLSTLFTRMIVIEAMVDTSINMQAQIIAKLEERDKSEVIANARKAISTRAEEIFKSL